MDLARLPPAASASFSWLGRVSELRQAMLWYMDPHNPYDPPREYQDKYLSKKEIELVTDKLKVPYNDFSEAEKNVMRKLYDGCTGSA